MILDIPKTPPTVIDITNDEAVELEEITKNQGTVNTFLRGPRRTPGQLGSKSE